jgi:hypothetical protein
VLIMPAITQGGELVGRRTHERSPEAAARKTDTADARGFDVCLHPQDVEGDPVVMGDHRRQAGSQYSAGLGDHVLVRMNAGQKQSKTKV